MKKIPTAFKRVFEGNKITAVLPEYTNEECKNAVENGIPTIKMDGSCCAIIGGKLYKRYDAKKGKPVPEGAIKCQDEPDEVTGHLPCWVKVDPGNKADKWFVEAYNRYIEGLRNDSQRFGYDFVVLREGTYEAIGKHFNGNPYNMYYDTLELHGIRILSADIDSFEAAKEWLESHPEHEGIVWWDFEKDVPVCKLKRSDFGLEFPVKEENK